MVFPVVLFRSFIEHVVKTIRSNILDGFDSRGTKLPNIRPPYLSLLFLPRLCYPHLVERSNSISFLFC